jgi:hypothetical protein
MKHFDENGNFVNTPKPEEVEGEFTFFNIDKNVLYEYISEKEKE